MNVKTKRTKKQVNVENQAIDVRGRELSRGAFEFSNTSEGFENAKAWMLELAAKNDKKQIVLGLEPTGIVFFVNGRIRVP